MISQRLEGISGWALTDCRKLVKIVTVSEELTLGFFSEI